MNYEQDHETADEAIARFTATIPRHARNPDEIAAVGNRLGRLAARATAERWVTATGEDAGALFGAWARAIHTVADKGWLNRAAKRDAQPALDGPIIFDTTSEPTPQAEAHRAAAEQHSLDQRVESERAERQRGSKAIRPW
jgi:hypothetical protein